MPAHTAYAPGSDTFRMGFQAVASPSNLTSADLAQASTQHAGCPHVAMIKSTHGITKRRYPLWAFLFVFVLPPFALYAVLSGRAEIIERPLPLNNPAVAATIGEHVLAEPFVVETFVR